MKQLYGLLFLEHVEVVTTKMIQSKKIGLYTIQSLLKRNPINVDLLILDEVHLYRSA